MDEADDGDGSLRLAYGGDAGGFVRPDGDGGRLAGGRQIYTRRRPGLETLAADFPAHPCFCEPVVAVCLVARQRRGRECGDGLFSVSAGYDVVRVDLV